MKVAIAIALVLVTLIGCGGGHDLSETGSGGAGEVVWPDRGGSSSTALPPVVQTGRIVFESQSGESCCVAVDPTLLSGGTGNGVAILDDLPTGPATVSVAGFAGDFAPAVANVVDTCVTIPASAAQPCDPTRVAAAAFESDPLAVTIVAGVQTNLGQVPMKSFPFLLDFSPAQDEETVVPLGFGFTVVDAVTDVRRDSIALEVSFEVANDSVAKQAVGLVEQSSFRLVTKRIPIQLSGCADGTALPCSPGGQLALAGFKATGQALALPEGEIEAHIVAENLNDPPQALDFRYSFVIVATPVVTPTATPGPDDAAAGGT